MEAERDFIKISVYIYTSRRVRIYTPEILKFIFKYTTLSREEYNGYHKTLAIVARTIEEMGFQDKAKLFIKPWYLWFWRPFLKGAFSSPVIIIDNEIVSTGKIPSESKIKEVLTRLERKHIFLKK